MRQETRGGVLRTCRKLWVQVEVLEAFLTRTPWNLKERTP